MVDFMAYLAARPGTCLWIADTEYTARLLAGGAPPWLDVASLIAWRQQAQTLLRPSVTVLDVGALVEAWLGYRADLRQTAVAKRGPAAALGAVLADDSLKQHVSAVLRGLKRSYPGQPLALVMPSPLAWLSTLIKDMQHAHSHPADEEIEDAAVDLADFLRAFGSDEVDVLALVEDSGAATRTPDLFELYDPVINVARHYRWAVGLDLTALPSPCDVDPPVDFLIAKQGDVRCLGQDVSAAVWYGDKAPQATAGGFLYLRIPADTNPEEVLTRLAAMRA